MKELQELFDHMYNEHGLILLETEMFDIISIVNKIQEKESKSNFCQSCRHVFSDALVDGKCSECRESNNTLL